MKGEKKLYTIEETTGFSAMVKVSVILNRKYGKKSTTFFGQ